MLHTQFFKTFLKDPNVGAFFPSSQAVVRKVVQQNLHCDAKYIVEYGAGNGVITAALLRAIPQDGKVVAIETNKEFLPALRAMNDPRLVVLCSDVRNVIGDFSPLNLPHIDAVVSGIPLSFFTKDVRQWIVAQTALGLSSQGQFIVYQHTPLVLSMLKERFNSVAVSFEPRNVFPYFIMNARGPKMPR